MPQTLNDCLQVFTSRPSDTEAYLAFVDMTGGQMKSLSGSIKGPRCTRARTLAATFGIEESEFNGNIPIGKLIPDPCYWTPQLPFLYDIALDVKFADGSQQSWTHSVGLRRWEVVKTDLFRERRRVVLRGRCVDDLSSTVLEQAVEAEVTLSVPPPSEEQLQAADELGVSLIVDLRKETVKSMPGRHSWHPSVAGLLLTEDPGRQFLSPNGAMLCGFAAAGSSEPTGDWAQVVVAEFSKGELPDGLANLVKPVIAIRRADRELDFTAARAACDQLQADLAPEFDLAGYFV